MVKYWNICVVGLSETIILATWDHHDIVFYREWFQQSVPCACDYNNIVQTSMTNAKIGAKNACEGFRITSMSIFKYEFVIFNLLNLII